MRIRALSRDIDAVRAIQAHRQGKGPDPYSWFNLPSTSPEAP